MASDEPRRKDDGNDKPKKWQCCVCRSTKEHRCYKCFCGKCPSYNKKIPPRYGVNDRSYSRPSNSSSALPRSEETKVSESVPMDTSAKQSIEIKDLRTGDEQPLGFSSDKDGDRYKKAISPNLDLSIVEEQKGKDEVGKKSNEVDGGSSKSNAGSTSIWEILAAKELKASGKQEEWANNVRSVSSWGPGSVNEQRGHSTRPASSWGDKRVEEPRAPRKQEERVNKDGPGSSWGAKKVEEPRNLAGWGNAAGKTVSWGVPRGTKDTRDNRYQENNSQLFSPVPHVESGSRWNSSEKISTKESEELNKGNDEPSNQKILKIEDDGESSKINTGSTSIWNDLAAKATTASGNQAVWANKVGASASYGTWHANEPRGNASGSFSSRDRRRERDPRGNEEITSTRAQDRSSKPSSPIKQIISGSRLDSDTRKRSRGDEQRVTNRSEDMASSPVIKRRENPEVKPCRFTQPDLLNHHEPSTKLVSLAVGNQEIMDGKTEQGSSAMVPALAANESTGYPVSGKNLVPNGEYVAAIVPKNIQVLIRENKKNMDQAISPRQAKPPPIVISGQNSSSKQECHDSDAEDLSCPSSRDLVGPAKEIIWKGCFEFLKFTGSTISESYLAHLAAKVNVEAHKFVSQISGHLQLKMHRVASFWPNLFIIEQPDARDIALYFYPENSERSTKEYAHLLHIMSEQDMMLRSSMEGVDLLIFSSKLLKRHHQRLKGRDYYMWGVFRQLGNNKFP